MFGHGQHDNGTQNTSQSSWAASSRAQQEPTPPEQLQAQQFYSDVGHYRQYTLTNPAHAGHYDYSTNAEQNLTQQRHLQEQPGEREPPNSAGSVGSGSVSSGESAATTGPSTVSQQPNIHYSHESLPQTPSSTSHQAPSSASFAQNNASMQGSPLFAVPPGYRTMLSSDKLSAALQPFDSSAEVGGSAPVRHNSMPSSIVSTSAGPPRSSGEISGTPQSQHTYHSPSQPPSQHHSQHVSYTQPPTPSSITHPFLHAPVPHYLSGSAPILQSSLTQEPLQHQLPGPSPHQSHFHSSSSSASGSGSSSLAAHSGSSASSGNQSSVSSDTGPLAKHSRYPRRHLHQVSVCVPDSLALGCALHEVWPRSTVGYRRNQADISVSHVLIHRPFFICWIVV